MRDPSDRHIGHRATEFYSSRGMATPSRVLRDYGNEIVSLIYWDSLLEI